MYVDICKLTPVVTLVVCTLTGGAETVAVICCVAAEEGVLKPAGVEIEIVVVPAVTGWKLKVLEDRPAVKLTGEVTVPTAVLELVTTTCGLPTPGFRAA